MLGCIGFALMLRNKAISKFRQLNAECSFRGLLSVGDCEPRELPIVPQTRKHTADSRFRLVANEYFCCSDQGNIDMSHC